MTYATEVSMATFEKWLDTLPDGARFHRLGEMRVQRIFSEGGRSSHIEPPLDPGWSELTVLRWWAAAAELAAEGDVRITVTHGLAAATDRAGLRRVWDSFCLNVSGPGGSTGYSSADYETTRHRIDGIEMGLTALHERNF